MKPNNIKNHEQLLNSLEDMSWQDFEVFVGKIFEFHNYRVEVNKVICYETTKHQYDVIAQKEHSTILADCKKWDNKRRIKHGLKRAAEKQIERVKKMNLKNRYPMIVTSGESPIELYQKVPIVPIQKLNYFLTHFNRFKSKVTRI
ncbi:MAG: restriction endonuclease [Candidatus Hadarchaeia archaeon]